MKKMTNMTDANGCLIPYGALIDFTWWEYTGIEVERHFKVKIRHRRGGDVFEFVEDDKGKPMRSFHRLTALNWSNDDLTLVKL